MQILNGKQIAEDIRQELKSEIDKLPDKPGLAAVLVGDNPASKTYIGLKEKACQETGINFFKHELPASTQTTELVNLIKTLNQDTKVSGVLVQLPLPEHIHTQQVMDAIDPEKDADGFHPDNVKLLKQGKPRVIPPLPAGIIRLLEETGQSLSVATAVILANSEEFANPLQQVLAQRQIKSASLIKPREYSLLTQKADILITALGRPHLIKAEDIKNDAILIDAGYARIDGKVMGDIDPDSVKDKAGWLSPVPGGTGPLTVAYLLKNVVELAKR